MKPEHRRAFDEVGRSLKTELFIARLGGPGPYAAWLERKRVAAEKMHATNKHRRFVMGPQEKARERLGEKEYARCRAQGRVARAEHPVVDARDCPYKRWSAQFVAWCAGACLRQAYATAKQIRAAKDFGRGVLRPS